MTPNACWPEQPASSSDRIERYSQLYTHVTDRDFEETLVYYRQRSVLGYLGERQFENIVEVGCGLDLMVLAVKTAGLKFRNWIIVEPSARFAIAARQQTAGIGDIMIVEDFFETTAEALMPFAGTIDLVLLSGLLHEVDDPGSVLARAHALLKPNGHIYVVVPNAESLHRRLAVAMGLIDSLTTPSDRNRILMQRRIFDPTSLAKVCADHNFEVTNAGGMFLKPFTNDQMMLCAPHLPPDVMTGLWKLGCDMPDLASEIFVEARKISPSDRRPA